MEEQRLKQEIQKLCAEMERMHWQAAQMRVALELDQALFQAALSAASYDSSRKAVGAFIGSDVLYSNMERIGEALKGEAGKEYPMRLSELQKERQRAEHDSIFRATLRKGNGDRIDTYEIDPSDDEEQDREW